MSNLRKYKDKILRERDEEEIRKKIGMRQSANSKRQDNYEKVPFFKLFLFSVLIFVASEFVIWYFSQEDVREDLRGIWNFLSLPTLHSKILFWIQDHLPKGHDFSGLVNGISYIYKTVGETFAPAVTWLIAIPYALFAWLVGGLITFSYHYRVNARELFTVSGLVFFIKLLSYTNEQVNFLDLISIIAFVLLNFFVPLMLFFVCFVAIFAGSEYMVYRMKNEIDDSYL